jgi:hypothetical protein
VRSFAPAQINHPQYVCVCATAANIREHIGWKQPDGSIEVDLDAGSPSHEPEHPPSIHWATHPNHQLLDAQPFAPEKPGSGKYGDPTDDELWAHYVQDKNRTPPRWLPAPCAQPSKAAAARDGVQARVGVYAHSLSHWRHTLEEKAPDMMQQTCVRHEVVFNCGPHGAHALSSDDERRGTLWIPSSKEDLFEPGGVRLKALGQEDLRFPIFQPSAGRHEKVSRHARGTRLELGCAVQPPASAPACLITVAAPPLTARKQGFLDLSTVMDGHRYAQVVCVKHAQIGDYRTSWPVRAHLLALRSPPAAPDAIDPLAHTRARLAALSPACVGARLLRAAKSRESAGRGGGALLHPAPRQAAVPSHLPFLRNGR